jgi:glycerophosphoryl diester phosphodiesterase
VLFHDAEFRGRPFEEQTRGEIESEYGPLASLADLEPLASRARLVIEVKRSGFEEKLHATVRDWPDITISSFDHRVLRTLRDLRFEGKLGLLFSGYLVALTPYARTLDASVVFAPTAFVDATMVIECRREGLDVIPWTANDPREWERLRRLGCSGVITDVPDLALSWRS